MTDSTTLDTAGLSERALGEKADTLALVVAWYEREPSRVGEVLLVPREGHSVFGRGAAEGQEAGAERLGLIRQRPGSNERTPPLDNPFLSRQQLKLTIDGDAILVENVGKRPLLVDGTPVSRIHVRPGDVVEIKQQRLFYCAPRPMRLEAPRFLEKAARIPFGEVDAHGILGESPVAWALRDQIAFFGGRAGHVILVGESGTGKELIAQAIHALSSRADRKLVSRSAATFPPGLIDAELFGNVANYPNPGMPERPGLIGAADGSTLFLDEIGELPSELQAHLLRVLDRGGDYQRLGESKRRAADVRLVAATNRGVHELKHDLAARLGLRMLVPTLNDRRSDVPLLARHLLRRIAAEDAVIGKRFLDAATKEPRITLPLVRALLRHTYRTHVRELETLLWTSLGESTTDALELTAGVRASLAASPSAPVSPAKTEEISAEAIAESLARNGGMREKVWRELGMANRHVLKRLIKKYGLADKDDDE